MGSENNKKEIVFEFKIYSDKSLFLALRTNFTQGGVNVVSLDKNSTPDEKHGAQDRIGWVGWAGLGGSVFQVGISFENM